MFTVALQVLGRPELAADAVQQAFVQAWRAAPSYAAESDIAPWLFTITRRAAIDAWRRSAGTRSSTLRRTWPIRHGRPSLERSWEAWQIRKALDELPVDERAVVRTRTSRG